MFFFMSRFFVVAVVLFSSQLLEAAFHPERSSPRSLGVGEATVSSADDTSAFVVNPAGLSRHASIRRLSGHGFIQRKPSHYNVSGAFIDGVTEDPLHWGFRFQHQSSALSKFQDYGLGLSSQWGEHILFGTSQHLQHFKTTARHQKTWAYTWHAGLLLLINDYWAFGASIENPYRFTKKRAIDPMIVRSGMSLNLESWRFLTQYDFDASHETQGLKAGLEWRTIASLTLRGGFFHDFNRSFRRDDSLARGYSLGASLEPDRHFSLDLAFLDQLKSSERILSFGLSVRI